MVASFTENLRPGRTYQVVVKTVSGSVASWPATGNVTTRPLPVRELRQEVEEESGDIRLIWDTNPDSQQDSFKVRRCLERGKGSTKVQCDRPSCRYGMAEHESLQGKPFVAWPPVDRRRLDAAAWRCGALASPHHCS